MSELYLPPEARVEILRDYAKRYQLRNFVETGTSDGYTTWALRDDFAKIDTIEIDYGLWSRARVRFVGYGRIACWYGDSGVLLPGILYLLDGPALFWLDGHWCGSGPNPDGPDTPIRAELPLVLSDPRPHVVLIDDARCFREGADWESERYDWPTLTWVREQAVEHCYDYELADDVIRLTPAVIPYKYFGVAE